MKDNILLPLVLTRLPVAQMEERLLPIVTQLGIETLLEKYPYELSGGQKQRDKPFSWSPTVPLPLVTPNESYLSKTAWFSISFIEETRAIKPF